MKRIHLILLFAVLPVLHSCSKPPCVGENLEGMTVSWGEKNKITQEVRGYSLDDDGKIVYYEKSPGGEISKSKAARAEDAEFCGTVGYIMQGFIDNQVLHTPGVVSRFVEMRTPATNVVMRGVWNPTFKLNGSEEFVEMYDRLMLLIPDEDSNKEYLTRRVSSDEKQFQIKTEEHED